jgi:hypothetical protein
VKRRVPPCHASVLRPFAARAAVPLRRESGRVQPPPAGQPIVFFFRCPIALDWSEGGSAVGLLEGFTVWTGI